MLTTLYRVARTDDFFTGPFSSDDNYPASVSHEPTYVHANNILHACPTLTALADIFYQVPTELPAGWSVYRITCPADHVRVVYANELCDQAVFRTDQASYCIIPPDRVQRTLSRHARLFPVFPEGSNERYRIPDQDPFTGRPVRPGGTGYRSAA